MLGRRKQTPQTAIVTAPERLGAKNRPTPSRKEAEAARKRPLVPNDRRAATKASREAARLQRLKAREAMMGGEEKYLPARDRGPVRRYVRDYVDARVNVGEFLLPVMLVVLLASVFSGQGQLAVVVFFAMYGLVALAVIDGFVLGLRLKRRLVARFGAEQVGRGAVMYGVLRAFQLRRSRIPRPQVARRQYPD